MTSRGHIRIAAGMDEDSKSGSFEWEISDVSSNISDYQNGRDVGELVMSTNAYFFELETDLDGAETPSNPADNTQASREETGIVGTRCMFTVCRNASVLSFI